MKLDSSSAQLHNQIKPAQLIRGTSESGGQVMGGRERVEEDVKKILPSRLGN